ncbi:hypothetical protein M9H77_34974 [Catharanthus roseus]|uniref:Uncharacterized protein n=1 Tax=Catharanthus roseus TaxID=4058 RepID=A0ACB9ZNK9_CATRO|nr:hypothetical protein M9H77_34974 [Catharanthus roseus]
MIGRFTLDLDPIDKGRGTVGGLGPRDYFLVDWVRRGSPAKVVQDGLVGTNKSRTKPRVDDEEEKEEEEEEKVPLERQDPYGTKKCSCPFKLKGEKMATSENWPLFVHDERHNHAIGVYNHGHAQAAKLMEEH